MSSLKRKSEGPLASGDGNKKAKVNSSITSFFGAPKSSPGAPASSPSSSANVNANANANDTAPLSWNKDKWVASLTLEQKKHLQLEIQTLDPSWLQHLREEITSPEFINLKKFLENEVKAGKKVFPPRNDVYSWSRHTPFSSVRCVILGQDPYHNDNQAHGLCFSVRPPTKAPPSLKNMYIALKNDYPDFAAPPNNSGLLTPWAEHGVLMLNACLTVRAHEPNSHANRGWERFTQKVINLVAQKRTRGVVFMAWGKAAADRVAKVDTKRHLILKCPHPSPYSASKGFLDCGHFKKCNEWLALRYGENGVIDWDLNPSAKKAKAEVPPPVVTAGEVNEKGEEEKDIDEDEEAEAAANGAESD